MTDETLNKVGDLLSQVGAPDTFSAKRARPTDDLHLEVKGVGPIRFPVSRRQAQQLCGIGRPARYGKGEDTLLDRRVRDTWEIPKSRVKIDQRRWKRTLQPVLDELRADLGLPTGGRLDAELHSMLVYAPGQFFLPHQDSEKDDEMIGTLVVTLPSAFEGGAMIVEHQGERATYRGSKKHLSFVAFYADCRHEVKPVKKGYRIALTYNLLLDSNSASTVVSSAEPMSATIDALVDSLREHFETPLPPRWSWEKDEPPREPPSRLVYLLDHQYTERGLSWQRLKGNDAARATLLRAAAERYGCELVLALTEVHEVRSCFEPDPYRQHRRWARDEDDAWLDEDLGEAGPDAYELGDLELSEIELTCWIDSSEASSAPVVAGVRDEEVCSSTPTSELKAYASEYEGYMGNYGNTMDLWYRRAAIVLWPHRLAFVVRAEAAPAWALEELQRRIRSSQLSEAQAMISSLLPFWPTVAPREKQRGFCDRALDVAVGLEDSALAASLLKPFQIEAVTRKGASTFIALVKRYDVGWMRSLLDEWGSRRRYDEKEQLAWIASLPRLCQALVAADETLGGPCAGLLARDRWGALKNKIEARRGLTPPSSRNRAITETAKPILGILESAEILRAEGLRDEIVGFLRADENEILVPCLVEALRTATARRTLKARAYPSFDAIRQHCVERLEERLASPVRTEDDWSIELPKGCDCKLCTTLGAFLSDPAQQRLEWPLAKDGRQHVHSRIDVHELPVQHTTRRSGRPFTLVLSKTKALFKRETEERRSWQVDLAWLVKSQRSR